MHRQTLELGRAQVDTLIQDFDDHPNKIREIFNRSGMSAVAHVVAHGCQRHAPTLVAQNVLRAVTQVRDVRSPSDLARALGRPLRALGSELHDAQLPSPKRMLPWIRLLLGSLLSERVSVEDLARRLGYRSARALRNAFHRLVDATPGDVQSGGGLWFASARFRQALAAWRAR